MAVPSYTDNGDIAAPATSPLESALAIVRTSGDNALNLLARVFSRPGKLLAAQGNTIIHGWIVRPAGKGDGNSYTETGNEKIDEVLVSVYRAPKSYTGENGADISCHGGIATVRAIMETLKTAGFRDALPGEFTFRAFMHGKLDLTRSESVMELVSAKTEKAREHAVSRLEGKLEKEIQAVKDGLVTVLASAELFLDYSEDEAYAGGGVSDEEAGCLPERLLLEDSLDRLRSLSRSYHRERLYQEGALTVIAGRPNAGKSSLFNLLLGEDRAIVSSIPGTTRDWIEAWVSIEDIPIRLVDTAGLRDPLDIIENIGIERSRALLEKADLILYLIEGTEGFTVEDRAFLQKFSHTQAEIKFPADNRLDIPAQSSSPLIVLWNKADLSPLPRMEVEFTIQEISARTGQGLEGLVSAIAAVLEDGSGAAAIQDRWSGQSAGSSSPGTVRQKDLIDQSIRVLEESLGLADSGGSLDIITPLIRDAVNYLGEITGEVSPADILEAMFSRFCIGK
ncbi:MAG: tRNA uridine-5-carboxymethylaminomethyl(34) synthesis GTPase MnmE [Treponema sp.]|jgi:tRNA modification GTPase|nr:tRNA uridine-5-carboxymethylaminomethyl(34) synthesis GTPase MnmE [Treponema sp.]